MKAFRLVSALVLAGGLTLLATGAWAGSVTVTVSGGLRIIATGKLALPVAAASLPLLAGAGRMGDFGSARFDGPTYLIIDATPPSAQVFLDGRLLGTARQLVARAFRVPPGRHAVEIIAPGFRSYTAQFTSAPGSFPIRVRVALVPE